MIRCDPVKISVILLVKQPLYAGVLGVVPDRENGQMPRMPIVGKLSILLQVIVHVVTHIVIPLEARSFQP